MRIEDNHLIIAVQWGSVEQVEISIITGTNVNARNKQGHATALGLAASLGRLEIVEVLLQAGAEMNPDSSILQPTIAPLWCAAESGQVEVVKRLIKAGAKVNDGRQSAIIPAVSGGHLDVVQALVTAGAEIDLEMGEGVTPLMRAGINLRRDSLNRRGLSLQPCRAYVTAISIC